VIYKVAVTAMLKPSKDGKIVQALVSRTSTLRFYPHIQALR